MLVRDTQSKTPEQKGFGDNSLVTNTCSWLFLSRDSQAAKWPRLVAATAVLRSKAQSIPKLRGTEGGQRIQAWPEAGL